MNDTTQPASVRCGKCANGKHPKNGCDAWSYGECTECAASYEDTLTGGATRHAELGPLQNHGKRIGRGSKNG